MVPGAGVVPENKNTGWTEPIALPLADDADDLVVYDRTTSCWYLTDRRVVRPTVPSYDV